MRKSLLKTVVATAIVGAAMTVSSVVAMAATGDAASFTVADFGKESSSSKADYAQKTPISLEKNGTTFELKANGSDYIEDIGTRAGGFSSLKNTTGRTFAETDQEYRSNGSSRTITVKPAGNGELSFYFYDHESNGLEYAIGGKNYNSTKDTVFKATVDCVKGTAYTATITSKGCFLAVDFAPKAATSDKYNWSVDNIVIPEGLNVTKDQFEFGSDVTETDANTLKYTGSAYSVEVNPFDVSSSSIEEAADLGGGYKSYNVKVTLDATKFVAQATTEATVTVDKKLGLTGKVNFVDEDGNKIEGTVNSDGTEITATLYQNTAYTIDVLANAGYWDSQYVFAENENKIAATTATTVKASLSATKITTWDLANVGKTLPNLTFENGKVKYGNETVTYSGTYKGLTISASAGKIAFSGAKSQCKTDVTITAPAADITGNLVLNVYDYEGEVAANGTGYTVAVDGGTFTMTKTDSDQKNIYLSKLEIAEKAAVVVVVKKATATAASGNEVAPAVVKVDNDFFAVALVSEPDKLSSIKIGDQETTEVYKSVMFGGKEYDGSKLGGKSSNYLYAIAINTDAVKNAKTDDEMAEAIQSQAVITATALDA